MASTPRGIWYPETNNSVQPASRDFKNLAQTVDAAIGEALDDVEGGGGIYRGLIPEGADVNTIREPGFYIAPTAAHARSLVNWPTIRPGTLTVVKSAESNATTQQVTAYVSTTQPVEQYSRANILSSNANWSPWSSPEWVKGRLGSSANPVNADTYRTIGAWVVSVAGDVTGLPGSGVGVLEVMFTPATTLGLQRFTERLSDDNIRVWQRYSLRTSGWADTEWDALSGGGSSSPGGSSRVADVQVSDHATRLEYARSRRGGGIGTGGKPVFMWRFDHWMVAFRDKILPILREFSLPATLNLNYDNIDNPQNGGGSITWEHVQDWNQYDGIEIANHGSTHTNANTMETIFHEVVNGRRNLEAAMPRVAVETWQEHGSAYLTATDLEGDNGLDLGRTLESFTDSYAGRLVMAEHAVVEGKCGSFYPPLTGHPQIGQSHYSMDRQTANEAINTIRYAQKVGRGLTGYTHPGLMDQVNIGGSLYEATYNQDGTVGLAYDGGMHFDTETALRDWASTNGHIVHMPVKDFYEICAWLAAERDADRIMVMTAAGGGFADKSHDRRENLLVNPTFEYGTEDWSQTAGWTITNEGPDVVLSSSSNANPLSQGMLLHTRFGWAMGAAHELLVRISADVDTTLTLRMEQMGNPDNWSTEVQHTIPGDGVQRDYRLNLTLPRDPSISQMRIFLGGPDMTIHGAPLLAAI